MSQVSFRPFVACVVVGAVSACNTYDGPTYHADIEPLIQARCAACHVEGGIAPFPLDTYADAKLNAGAALAAIESKRMPPWLAAPGCNTYQADPTFSDAELATVRAWVEAEAPEGPPVDQGQGLGATPGLSRVDVSLAMQAPYEPSRDSSDDYRCFLLDWPETETAYVTGFRAKPGDPRIVHHVIAFLIRPADVAQYERLDRNEPGDGWTCYGGPGGRNQLGVNWLGAWAPGTTGNDYPAGTGLEVPPGSKVVMQVHYNTSANPQSLQDLSAVEFKVDPTVEKKAYMLPFANPDWVTDAAMPIPAGESDVVHAFSADPTPWMDELSDGAIQENKPFVIHQAMLHMHKLGTTASIVVRKKSGGIDCLLDLARWDFNWQASYRFTTPVAFHPGDALALECHWDNSKPQVVNGVRTEPHDMNWGEGTGDEMCLGLVYVSPP